MSPNKVELEGLGKLLDKLNLVPVLAAGIRQATIWIKGEIAKYPPRRWGNQPPKTAKQRRFLIWAISHKKTRLVDYPYRRGLSPVSKALGRKWTTKMVKGGTEGIIGNNVSYSQWVQDRNYQSAYHKKTGWLTTQEVSETRGPEVREFVFKEIEKHFKKS